MHLRERHCYLNSIDAEIPKLDVTGSNSLPRMLAFPASTGALIQTPHFAHVKHYPAFPIRASGGRPFRVSI
jgi:hypothetical protein